MNSFKKYIKLSILIFLVFGCGEFGDINVDPNNTTSVAPGTLLTASLRNISPAVSSVLGELYSQHMAETQYSNASRYETVNFDFNGWYIGPLTDLNHIIELNTNPETKDDALQSGSNANQIAVARILKAYFFHHITDRWGPLPYSEALKGRENFTPKYDSQQSIYMDLIKELKEANAQIDVSGTIEGDFLFGGNMNEWKKFANTLRMTIALRISNVDESTAGTEFSAAIADGLIDYDIMYPYLAEAANENPWFSSFITRTDFAISNVLVDFMKERNDSRLNNYADPAPNTGTIEGMPYGIQNAGDIPNADISFPNSTYVRAQTSPIGIFTMAQVLFSKAEAAHRGWISGNAQTYYEDAIRASFAQWGLPESNIADVYLQDDKVAWDDSKALQLIGEQKWIALYLQGYEAWNEWKRTGFPELQPAPDPLNASGQIPRRQGYPTTERDLNSTNYNSAIEMLGGPDDLDTRLWWDK